MSKTRRVFAEYTRADVFRAATILVNLLRVHHFSILGVCAHAYEIGLDPRDFDTDTARALASMPSAHEVPAGNVWFIIANNALRRSIGFG